MTTTDWPKESIQSDDMNMLEAVLKQWCAARSVDVKSAEGQRAARSLIDWYEFGIRDPAELGSLLEG